MTDYPELDRALQHLGLQLANHERARSRSELNVLDREAIAESVIQRFETAYDCLWKTLKRYLAESLGVPDAPNSPKPLFRIADDNGLLEGRIADWLAYADARTATAHDDSGEKAAQTIALVPQFLVAALDLRARMVESSDPQ